jgi:ketosteroid isomerase-like protein
MPRIKYFVATLVFSACTCNTPANKANAAIKADNTAPTKPALMTLENSAYQAWKTQDTKFWDTYLSDKFVGYGWSGKLDKASATQEYSGAGCEIKSYALSEGQLTLLDDNAALLTFKTTIDGTCGGQKVPANSWAASVYVRDGDRWKDVFHAESPIVDPASLAAHPVVIKQSTEPAAHNPDTDAMLSVERNVWEDWRTHDADKIAALTATDISFINIFGTHLATKADALKNWSGAGCDVKRVSVIDATATMLSPTVGILTFTGTADGTCYGQTVGPIWGSSVYVKDGNAWRWAFGINTPAHANGA